MFKVLDEDTNELFWHIVDKTPNLVIVKNFEGKFIFANSTIADLYNTTPEALIGKDDYDFNKNSAQVDSYIKSCQEIILSGQVKTIYESSTNSKNGEVRYYKSTKIPFKNKNGKSRILIIAADITELEDSKKIIAEKEKQLEYVLTTMQESVWNWNIKTGELHHNDVWCEKLGYTAKDFEYKIADFAKVLHPEDYDEVLNKIRFAKLTNQPYISEHRLLKRDGTTIWVRDRGAVVERDSNGEPLRMIGSFLDITHKKKEGDQLLQINATLSGQIDEAIKNLEKR